MIYRRVKTDTQVNFFLKKKHIRKRYIEITHMIDWLINWLTDSDKRKKKKKKKKKLLERIKE